MNNSMISSSVSLAGIQQKIDVISGNIANVNTVGYKSKDATFEDTLTRVQDQSKQYDLPGRKSPLGYNLGFGSYLAASTYNMSQGSLQETGKETDFAIQGNALFAVDAGGTQAWTREGDFQLSPDSNGDLFLTTNQGYFVLDTNGQPIQVANGSHIRVDAQGNVTEIDLAGNENVVAQLNLVEVARPESLVEAGGNLYKLAAGANASNVFNPVTDQASVRQGFLEQSNVDLTKEMTDLTQAQRAYQLAARALTSSDNMMSIANNLRG
ncbi:flagellar hook-basal body protein [Paenibacillus sediminis]|uniref:Flagellar basal-body rod protein FlgG n=1 Tax=Paenibacillus sediminis TaxID=664909 RepID=A0ABS4H2C5_9BACL|nr:flagellar hook-basal body protein [Paenibacillus sediminis]MBP1936688.1 flagellar basal-body rod protein FlgG [Paenibacillus sediminis]